MFSYESVCRQLHLSFPSSDVRGAAPRPDVTAVGSGPSHASSPGLLGEKLAWEEACNDHLLLMTRNNNALLAFWELLR